jgi:hypothetical protein
MSNKIAFRCRTCGRLEAAGHAGDNQVPHACRVCCAGVSFCPRTGTRKLHLDNWEVLADCSTDRLTELEISPEQVERHTPSNAHGFTNRPSVSIMVSVSDGISTSDGL